MFFKIAEGREFRRESGVPAFIGSSDASQLHCNLVIVGAVLVIPDVSSMHTGCVRYCNSYKTASFSKGAINTPKPPPLEAADSAGCNIRF